MKRKGFTLIELLAVIVILAVIAIITIPLIGNAIEQSKKNALKESANALIEEAGYYYLQYGVSENIRFDINDNQINKVDGNTLLYKGDVKDATVLINTKGEVSICINDGDYSVYKNYRDKNLIEIDNKNCNIPTGQSVVFLENESTINEYSNQELTQLVQELQLKVNQLENDKDTNPIGTVISYIVGYSAPSGYLPCDGTVYNITDYPDLASAIKNGLGSYNYYGGDGITTFAVPDLRGEFLRGTGTSTRNTGSGANVGVHQNGSYVPRILRVNEKNLVIYGNSDSTSDWTGNQTTGFDITSYGSEFGIANTNNNSMDEQAIGGTIRPTNTSVLYCIKY